MGIVIGVSISSGCIVVCVIIILLRNRYVTHNAIVTAVYQLEYQSLVPVYTVPST